MSGICHSCSLDVSDEHVTCHGFCGATFHVACCKVPAELLKEVVRNPQIFWMCNSCSKLMADIRIRRTIRSAFDSGHASSSANTDVIDQLKTEILSELKTEILSELKTEIRSNFTALVNSSALTPKTSRRLPVDPVVNTGRRLLLKPDTSQPRKPDNMVGTSTSASPSHGITTVPMQNKFWIYLSRISRDVSVEQISALTKQRLNTDDVEVVKLVAKGKDVSTLSFVSFKVGIDAKLKDKALTSSTWPYGVIYREFNDTRRNFWRPELAQTPTRNILERNRPPPSSEVVMTTE